MSPGQHQGSADAAELSGAGRAGGRGDPQLCAGAGSGGSIWLGARLSLGSARARVGGSALISVLIRGMGPGPKRSRPGQSVAEGWLMSAGEADDLGRPRRML